MKRPVTIALLFGCLLSACAEVKETGRAIGHGTRDVARGIGHGTRAAAKGIGHGFRDAAREIGHGFRDAVNGEGQRSPDDLER